MFCPHCGKSNTSISKFCRNCGNKLDFSDTLIIKENHEPKKDNVDSSTTPLLDPKIKPFPYVISLQKLIILSILTFGLYEIFWFYKQWVSFKAEKNLKVEPSVRAFFATIMSYSLFKVISNAVKELDKKKGFSAGSLALLYLGLIILYRLPDPYWLISLFSFIPLIPVQKAVNYYWIKKYGDKVISSKFGFGNYIWSFLGGILLSLECYLSSCFFSITYS